MDKPDTSRIMRQLATRMRQQAQETAQPEYRSMMHRTADMLDHEAGLIADRQLMELARLQEILSASQFKARHH